MHQAHIANLWLRLAEIYGSLFISKHGAQDSGVWFETLRDLTPIALESGLERLRTLSGGAKFAEYPPNCLQFRALCLAFYEELNLPQVGAAYKEIRLRSYVNSHYWSHPVVKFTASKLPVDFLMIENEQKAYALFVEAYTQVCNLVKQGHKLPVINDELVFLT